MKKIIYSCSLLLMYNVLIAQVVQVRDMRTQSILPQAFAISTDDRVLEADRYGVIDFSEALDSSNWTIYCMSYQSALYNPKSALTTVELRLDPLMISELLVTDQKPSLEDPLIWECGTIIYAELNPSSNNIAGTPAELTKLPGLFVDGSLGEVFSRVHTRGISASAEDDIGWYYTSLQEDGLPLTAVQYNYFTPDMYHRSDIMTERVTFENGGRSALVTHNSPGGAINYRSHRLAAKNHGSLKYSTGLEGDLRLYTRLDGMYNAHFESAGVTVAVGGFFRQADGHRNTPYIWSSGGQLRLNAQKTTKNGVVKLSYKMLNDQVNRYTGVTATDWANPQAAFGQDLNYTALMLPSIETRIPGGISYSNNNPNASYEFDPSRGIHVIENALRLDMDQKLGQWDINIASKWSRKSADWQTSFSNARVGLEDFIAYFISGSNNPFGVVSFKDVRTQETLAVVNNIGSTGPFQGQPASFEYISGSLPFDAIMGIAPWKKQDQLNEFMLQSQASRQLGQHHLRLGMFSAYSDLDYFTNASFAYATFEPQPRYLEVSLVDFYGDEYQLSDRSGLSNYGALFFENGAIQSRQLGLFVNDQYRFKEHWSAEGGVRYQYINHVGALVIPGSTDATDADLDGDLSTVYDQNILVPSGAVLSFDDVYQSMSWMGSLAYQDEQKGAFLRLSKNQKSPELNYYINNFSGETLPPASPLQNIMQAEVGARYLGSQWSLNATGFYTQLDNIPFSGFDQDQNTGEIFYTTVQLNATTTYGLELAWAYIINNNWKIMGNHTFQKSVADAYTIVNSNDTKDTSDDTIIDFKNATPPHVPSIMTNATLEYNVKRFTSNIGVNYMGKRYGNIENAFTLPDYFTIETNLNYQYASNLRFSLMVKNLTNAAGLANFFGPNSFGASANDATAEYIQNNPNGDFVVFPILPRAIYINCRYDF